MTLSPQPKDDKVAAQRASNCVDAIRCTPGAYFRATSDVANDGTYDDFMPQISAGLLMYRRRGNQLQVLLVHPGGPFWRNKDAEAWSIPKGEVNDGEDLLAAAKREFQEETGTAATGQFIPLNSVRQTSGKIVHAWAVEGISIQRKSRATRSPWSGRRNPASRPSSPKWTEQRFSISKRRERKFSRRRQRFSAAWQPCSISPRSAGATPAKPGARAVCISA
jgi:ADP-ribose pyrophosphatase YjhB (NUDIX family)